MAAYRPSAERDAEGRLHFVGPFRGNWLVEDMTEPDGARHVAGSRHRASVRWFSFKGSGALVPLEEALRRHKRSATTGNGRAEHEARALGRFRQTRAARYEFAPSEPRDDLSPETLYRQWRSAEPGLDDDGSEPEVW